MQTKNTYRAPVTTDSRNILAHASPAHVGRLQYAIDFIVPEGTPMVAACDGTVVDIKDDSDRGGRQSKNDAYGNYIELAHAHGEYSIYEHIRQHGAAVHVGDVVRAGDVIGFSGATGWIADLGPHVHFDVHVYTGKGSDDYTTREIRW